MKKINILHSDRGHSMRQLQTQYWDELIQIESLDETANTYTIHLKNGKMIQADKNNVCHEDDARISYVGSLKGICDIPFKFNKLKKVSMYELWHMYFTPGEGGFSIMFSLE